MNHFDQEANKWDSPEKIKLMKSLATKTIRALELSKEKNTKIDMVDFGCGTGLFGLAFKDYAKSLIGIDTSQGMLNVFDEKTSSFPTFKSFNCDLEKDNIELSKLSEKFSADLILSSMAFHHLDNPAYVLKSLKRILKPTGKIAIVDLEMEDGSFHPDNEAMGVKHFGFELEQIQNWAQNIGLGVQIQTLNTLEKNGQEYKQFLAIFS